jgi:hypothetical protein
MVFGSRVLRKILGPKKEELAGDWRQLQSVELHCPYTSPSTDQVIKTRKN